MARMVRSPVEGWRAGRAELALPWPSKAKTARGTGRRWPARARETSAQRSVESSVQVCFSAYFLHIFLSV